MWFTKLIKQFFFWIDKIVFNFIPTIYDFLLEIARTSILTQADIAKMAERIYELLTIFMVFKVVLSLITYVVNPDDFSDKTKGVAKLGTNIIISLSLLILTPYIFSYAYQIQTIVLEDNSLATLIFGDDLGNRHFVNTAGDEMAYITIQAFFAPNLTLGNLHECTKLYETVYDDEGNPIKKMNPACYTALEELIGTGDKFESDTLETYKAGIENGNFGLLFREDLAVATGDYEDNGEDFIMDYKFIFSTAVGIVVVLLLINFCMDVAVRSIKLAFYQLIAPIPILSYIDPKSGKDGLFKKWYEACFKTFLSLFIRLLSLYFAVYIISKVGNMQLVDVVDGSYKGGFLLYVFVVIGALMFAKQLPKILENLGIKLDGDGKFTLNPLKKFEEGALGGKRFTGALGGAAAGLIGGKGNPLSMLGGAARGAVNGKGFSGGMSAQAAVNRKKRELRAAGYSRFGASYAGLASRFGLDDVDLDRRTTKLRKNKEALNAAAVTVDRTVKTKEAEKKRIEDGMAVRKQKVADHKKMQDAIASMEKRAKDEIELGHGGHIGREYLTRKATAEYYENNIGKKVTIDGKKVTITPEMAGEARQAANDYLTDIGMKQYMSEAAVGGFDKTFSNAYEDYRYAAGVLGITTTSDGGAIHGQYGESKGAVGEINRELAPEERIVSQLNDEIRNAQADTDVVINGKTVKYEEARRIVEEEEKYLSEIRDKRKRNKEYSELFDVFNSNNSKK